jgi:hypothetical protein
MSNQNPNFTKLIDDLDKAYKKTDERQKAMQDAADFIDVEQEKITGKRDCKQGRTIPK